MRDRAKGDLAAERAGSSSRISPAAAPPRHNRKALYAYNHAWWDVNKVLAGAGKYR